MLGQIQPDLLVFHIHPQTKQTVNHPQDDQCHTAAIGQRRHYPQRLNADTGRRPRQFLDGKYAGQQRSDDAADAVYTENIQ